MQQASFTICDSQCPKQGSMQSLYQFLTLHPILRLGQCLIALACLNQASTVVASPPALTAACEAELALSALPARLRDQATAYVYVDGAFEAFSTTGAKQDSNFSCVVERNHPQSLIPQCLDQVGSKSILPALFAKSERILAGDDPNEVRSHFHQQLADGTFTSPEGAGVSYMTSAYNLIYVGDESPLQKVGPHVMFYAPGVRNEDIGGSHAAGMENRGLPFVVDSGPHGYMISYTESPSDSSAVEAACSGQLGNYGFSAAP